MAQTDQRTGGFRLPWSSDQRSIAEQAVKDGDPDADPQDMTATDTSDREDGGQMHTANDDTTSGTVASAETETAGAEAADHPSTETQTVPAETMTAPPASSPARRQPSQFMHDLTKAMLAAAESQRTMTLSQLQADSKAYTEEIHGRSAGLASDLRKRADDDVAGIRDWQKAEIARVKEETDTRISGRKGELETQLETHAAVIEQAIDKVQSQVSAFETEMARFFELLVVEEDPTRFAAMAENLPEPPPFEGLAIGVEEIMTQAAAAVAVLAAPAKPETEAPVEAEAVAETAEEETPMAVAETVEAETDEATTHAVEGVADDTPQTPAEREAAMSAIAAAFEAAAQAEADASRAEAAAERSEAGAERSEHPGSGEAHEGTAGDADAEPATDPRLDALAQSSFDAAEAEAAAGAVSDDDGIATFGEDALSKRLGTLVPEGVRYPERQSAKTGPTKTTQVVVVGLVSVASIASFKRHLGRTAGVQSVGVSSGPDGEFVFAVTHGEDVSLRDMIPSLPGFQARVTNAGDGIINVTARDPESEG
ncbi:MAG TPA: hypothetical protein VF323_08880 [Candidatus Limnocylindrales bacterium]